MKNKPFFFTLISFMCMIEPAIKILYFKAITNFDFAVILANLQSRNTFLEVVDFWLVFPIAGLLILKLRKWTYFSFLSLLTYIIYNITTYEQYTWPYNSSRPFAYNYVVAAGAATIFAAFLSPRIREMFFESRVRWWEPKSRYSVNLYCRLQSSSLSFSSEILNISQTGAFLKASPHLKVGDRLQMEFNFLGQNIILPVEVVNSHSVYKTSGYGVRFNFKTFRQSLEFRKVIKDLKEYKGSVQEDRNIAA